MRISTPIANLHSQASTKAETTSQALYGESIRVLNEQADWLEIELQTDKYTGFIQSHQISHTPHNCTHRVINKATPLFAQADIKSPVAQLLSLGSELNLLACEQPQFWKTDTEHYVWKQHTQAIDHTFNEPLIDIAQKFFSGAPYVWGGRSTNGLDCSALVQLSAMLKGKQLPRDTQDQEAYFRAQAASIDAQSTVKLIDYSQRQANDLMYWPGHVAIVKNLDCVFHATAHSLNCCEEPLSAVEERAGVAHAVFRL